MGPSRKTLTQTLVDAAPTGYTVDSAMSSWWYNKRETGGFRLTDRGVSALLEVLDLEHFELKLKDKDLDSRTLIELDKNLSGPYYIRYTKSRPTSLVMFSSRDATMAILYDDLKLFAQNLPGGRQGDSL